MKRSAMRVIRAKSSTGSRSQRKGVSRRVNPSIKAMGVVVMVTRSEKA